MVLINGEEVTRAYAANKKEAKKKVADEALKLMFVYDEVDNLVNFLNHIPYTWVNNMNSRDSCCIKVIMIYALYVCRWITHPRRVIAITIRCVK